MPSQNAINNVLMNPINYGYILPGCKFVGATLANVGSGDVDLYTCPAGKRAYVVQILLLNNDGVNTLTYFPEIKVSGTYYRINTTGTVNPSTYAKPINSLNYNLCLEAGESFSMNINQSSQTIWLAVIEFDNIASLSTHKLLTLASGDNTIYTVPAGKTAILLNGNAMQTAGSSALSLISYYNTSGSARSIKFYIVKSGDSTGSTNQSYQNASVSNNNTLLAIFQGCATLAAGDFVVINTDSNAAGQVAWANVLEI